jgi:hypothetical protein
MRTGMGFAALAHVIESVLLADVARRAVAPAIKNAVYPVDWQVLPRC